MENTLSCVETLINNLATRLHRTTVLDEALMHSHLQETRLDVKQRGNCFFAVHLKWQILLLHRCQHLCHLGFGLANVGRSSPPQKQVRGLGIDCQRKHHKQTACPRSNLRLWPKQINDGTSIYDSRCIVDTVTLEALCKCIAQCLKLCTMVSTNTDVCSHLWHRTCFRHCLNHG